ncbi:MAG: sigma-70 family RNA polymerase sigma factor, partial [Thermoanaerobaculia bacterium]
NQELYSMVMLKVVQNDYAVLRGFQGKCRWSTYLTVIIRRVLLDHRVKEWGRWRPCTRARRLGTTAVRLDRRINRDGLEPAEAIRELLARGVDETATDLESLAERIPRRPRRRFLSGDTYLKILADREEADRRVEAAERHRAAARLNTALSSALQELSGHERSLLGMRFGRGWTVRRIATSRNLEERPLYRRFQRILRQLRHRLEGLGLGWKEIAAALDGQDVELEIDLR